MIRPTDDHFHARLRGAHWTETSCNYFLLPERNMTGLIYIWHKPNLGCTGAQVCLWDETASERNQIRFYEYAEYNELRATDDMFDFELEMGLRCRLVEPLRKYEWSYSGDGLELELVQEGVSPVYERLNPAGEEGSRSADFEAISQADKVHEGGNYSQGARMTGTLTLEGEALAVDSIAFRDHSWGLRPPIIPVPRGNFAVCFTGESGFDMMSFARIPLDQDPIWTDSVQAMMGTYHRDGKSSPIVGGETRVLARGEDGRPLEVEVEGTDKLGRHLHATGTVKNWFRLNVFTRLTDTLSLTEWRFDGVTAHGISEEFMSHRHARRGHRLLHESNLSLS